MTRLRILYKVITLGDYRFMEKNSFSLGLSATTTHKTFPFYLLNLIKLMKEFVKKKIIRPR